MKTKFRKILALMILLNTLSTWSQNDSIRISKNIPTSIEELKKSFDFYKKDIPDKKLFNNQMLNRFFSSEVNSFASKLNDLSLEKYMVNINTDSKTLSIGRNFDLNKTKTHIDNDLIKTQSILSISATSSIDKGFSKIYSYSSSLNEYNFASDLSANIKFTFIGNGWISYDEKKHLPKIISNRDKVEKNLTTEINKETFSDTTNIARKYIKYYKIISDNEIKYLKEGKNYYSYNMFWFAANLTLPITYKEINIKSDNSAGSFDTKQFKNSSIDFIADYYRFMPNRLKGSSINLRGICSFFNNNSFIADNTKPTTFQTIINQNSDVLVLKPADLVFVGNYNEFYTSSLKLELSTLTFNNSIGISASIEKNFGDYDALNWKLGIPFSFKDNGGKPLANFECQWKEINGVHVVGISTAYIFGKFLK